MSLMRAHVVIEVAEGYAADEFFTVDRAGVGFDGAVERRLDDSVFYSLLIGRETLGFFLRRSGLWGDVEQQYLAAHVGKMAKRDGGAHYA